MESLFPSLTLEGEHFGSPISLLSYAITPRRFSNQNSLTGPGLMSCGRRYSHRNFSVLLDCNFWRSFGRNAILEIHPITCVIGRLVMTSHGETRPNPLVYASSTTVSFLWAIGGYVDIVRLSRLYLTDESMKTHDSYDPPLLQSCYTARFRRTGRYVIAIPRLESQFL